MMVKFWRLISGKKNSVLYTKKYSIYPLTSFDENFYKS